jgi:hypothetical protein
MKIRLLAVLVLLGGILGKAAVLTEEFDDITNLSAAGWAFAYNSNPLGTTGWFQGVETEFVAHQGANNAYIAANFNNTGSVGTISTWLLSPVISVQNGSTVDFYTRTVTSSAYPDRLEVRFSLSGASTNVGTTESSVGDFTVLLATINPTLALSGYPEIWTGYSLALSGLSGPTSGRLAFRYYVTDAGSMATNANYIGIDTLAVNDPSGVPEPATFLMMGVGLPLVMAYRRCRC